VTSPTYPAQRPATVSASTYLLWGTAAVSLLGAVLSLTTVGKLSDAYADLYRGTVAEGTESLIVGASVFGVVLQVLFSAGLVILAIYNNRGRNGARITTWVIGGLMLCCGGFGLAGNALSNQLSGLESAGGSTGGPSSAEVQAALEGALPSWYTPVTTTLSVISFLTILGAVILLALPASNAYFRQPPRGFDPSLPYPAYPGGQPPYPPGQPPYPPAGAPQYPTYPTYPQGQPPAQPPAQPQAQPPAQPPPPPPSSDPWSRPEDEQRPPSDPTAQP
jgi:hypothetical protein